MSKGGDYHAGLESLIFLFEWEGATMFQLSVYAITPKLWRWEIRCGGALLTCGTAPTRAVAERTAVLKSLYVGERDWSS